MKTIIIAKTAGFCMGVKRAVDMAMNAPKKEISPIYTYGPLIHNSQVSELLEKKGIFVLSEIPKKGSGTVIIRAHGIPLSDKEKLKNKGFKIINATCPHVVKVQNIIYKHQKKGYASIIIGDKEHPEVIGLMGYAGGKGFVIKSIEAFENLPKFKKAIIVAQTTQSGNLFNKIVEHAKKDSDIKIFNTICDSTKKRQDEIKELTKSVDAAVIVGGRHSGNTCRLAEIAAKSGKPSFHIETEKELDLSLLASADRIAITAGASTPSWVIKNVYDVIEKNLP
jgi:(E)-4-hydroxy-3-methyl-but-2-enyl pyrophosphate reductase